jgi:hypothetical protein
MGCASALRGYWWPLPDIVTGWTNLLSYGNSISAVATALYPVPEAVNSLFLVGFTETLARRGVVRSGWERFVFDPAACSSKHIRFVSFSNYCTPDLPKGTSHYYILNTSCVSGQCCCAM